MTPPDSDRSACPGCSANRPPDPHPAQPPDCVNCQWMIRGRVGWIVGVLVLWFSVLAYWVLHAA